MPMRMKVQTSRNLLYLGVLIGVAAILFLVSRLFIDLKKKKLFPQITKERIESYTKASASEGLRSSDSGEGARDYTKARVIYELNITGKEPPKPIEDGPGSQPVASEKPLEDVINVMLLFWALDPAKRCAKISYDEDATAIAAPSAPAVPGKRDVPDRLDYYRVIGDKLRAPYDAAPYNAKIVDITKEGVVCDWFGKQVTVKPTTINTTGIEKPPPRTLPGLNDVADPNAPPPPDAEALREDRALGTHGWFIGTTTRDIVEKDYEKLLDRIELAPDVDPKNRGRIRLKISKLPDDHLAAQKGFEVGDVIRKVNGQDVSSKASLANYIKENPGLSSYSIEIERRGSTITKEFQIAR